MDTLKETPLKKLGGFQETDSEIQFLENLFNEEIECQATHKRDIDTLPCSIEVRYRVTSSCARKVDVPVCESSASASFNWMDCDGKCPCGLRASDCWIITPI